MIPYPINKEKENLEKNNAQDNEINQLKEKIIDDGWHTIDPINGWGNYTEEYQTAQYKKVGNEVILRGMFWGSQPNKPACILPERYRPKMQNYFTAFTGTGAVCLVVINQKGEINFDKIGEGVWAPISGIRFFTD